MRVAISAVQRGLSTSSHAAQRTGPDERELIGVPQSRQWRCLRLLIAVVVLAELAGLDEVHA